MNSQYVEALIGGILIGIATSLFLWLNGRIAGNSGILAQAFHFKEGYWRLFYLLGLISGAWIFQFFFPGKVHLLYNPSWIAVILAGLLVGYGTRLGGGCTSGHGICGISRLSLRSIVATIIFMSVGFLTVYLIRLFGGAWWASNP